MLNPRGWLTFCFLMLLALKPLGGQAPDSGFRATEVDNLVIARKLEIERATGSYGFARGGVVALSHREDRIAVARDSLSVTILRIFALPSGRPLQKINVVGEIHAMAWSPDDSRIFFGGTSGDGTHCSVIELATGVRKGLPGICAPNGSYWVDDSTLVTPGNPRYANTPPVECNPYAMTCRASSRDWSGIVPKPFFSHIDVVSSVRELLFPYTGDPATYGLFVVSLRDSSYRDLGVSTEVDVPAEVIQLADPIS